MRYKEWQKEKECGEKVSDSMRHRMTNADVDRVMTEMNPGLTHRKYLRSELVTKRLQLILSLRCGLWSGTETR